jgi:predicted AAA+ superfamily ATPase
MRALLRGDVVDAPKVEDTLEDLIEHVVRGGWPRSMSLPVGDAAIAARDYLTQIVQVDAKRVGGERRQTSKAALALRALARNEGTISNISTLEGDVGVEDGESSSISRPTLYRYLELFEQLMIIEDQPAWSTHLRSKSAIRKSPKRRFVDPSLAVAAIGATPARLLGDLEYFGFLFESLVVRDVRTYAQACGASVYHYRDSDNLEVDIIVESHDGTWAALEVKLGVHSVDEAATNLLRFRDRVDTTTVGQPAALVVVVGSGYGYTRPDGVSVVPLTSLTA